MRWVWLIAAGCGGEGGGSDFARACDQSGVDGDCVLFSGAGWTAEDVTEACAADGTVADECPANGAVGACTIDGGADFETVSTFYTGFWTRSEGEFACSGQGGAWVEAR
jgi:hypothetical protein